MPLPRPQKGRFLFVCSLKLLFQETQAYGSGWCGGRVWVVCTLAFCMVEYIFFTSPSTQLVRRGGRLESEVLPQHPENSSSFQWWFWGSQWGRD